ncbi:862f767e-80e6-412a-a29a-9fc34c81f961 [Thermothielavioides terrestris]|uniref:chitin deacetylase n=1 Tax=Thermothielavioides terrestris TaxID=2587410 RepID=A0A3S4AK12_9PEZI|nr:862f767e-80e6-412a-a29a-9fc34c81f961 [Thermothielavioides terrestris]
MFPSLLRLPRRLRRRRMATLLLALLLALLVLLPPYFIYKPPSLLLRILSHRWTDVLFRLWLPPSKPLVALTIDDAPSEHTPAILAALAASGAHATFFVIGSQVAGRERMLRDILRAGHELANHGMHDEPARALPAADLAAQLRAVQALIDDAYRAEGRTPPPPATPTPAAAAAATTAPAPASSASASAPWPAAWATASMLSPGGIIVCHDRRSWTEPMLRRVLPEMKRRGYRAVTLSELLDEVTG